MRPTVKQKVTAIFLCLLIYNHSYCQITIWSENFDSYANGVTTGANNNTSNPSVDWTSSGCTTCPSNTDDWWEIRSGRMEARDVNNEYCSLISEVIDISSYANISFSVDISEAGDHEGFYLGADNCTDAANQDYVDIEYRIDGGAWLLINNFLGWCGLYGSCNSHTLSGDNGDSGDCRLADTDWVLTPLSISGINGNTIELRLSATNSSGDEYIRFDNIVIEGTTVLPIKLINFEVSENNQAIEIKWQTASENSNAYFAIERFTENQSWKTIDSIIGSGNSQVQSDYYFIDSNPLYGISYYRLKQADFNGSVTYSETKSITMDLKFKVNIYPNPTQDILLIEGIDVIGSKLVFYNSIGQQIFDIVKVNEKSITLNMRQYHSGLYYLSITKHENTTIKKVVLID